MENVLILPIPTIWRAKPTKQPDGARRHCRKVLELGLVVALALVPVLPVHATTPGYESCLKAWAEMKGWTRDPYAFGYVDGSDSYDIFIVYDRGDDWVNIAPYETRDDTKTRDAFQKRENIVTAEGFGAVKIHKMTKEYPTRYDKGYEAENWEYYCPDFKVLVRSRRHTLMNQTGSDPIGLLEDYLTFAQKCLDASGTAPNTKSPADSSYGISVIAIEGDDVLVDVHGTGDFIEAQKGVKLGPHSIVMTGIDSSVTIDFAEYGRAVVKQLSNYRVGSYRESEKGLTAQTNLKVGEVDLNLDRRFEEVDFSVSTPTCTVGVRGTEFTVRHDERPHRSTITVRSGSVAVTPKAQYGPPFDLGAGQSATIGERPDGTVSELEPVADTHVYQYAYSNWNQANWGAYEVLGAGWNPIGGEKRSFIRFDLSGIDLEKVTSAKLRLYRYHRAGDGTKPLGVYRITEPWVEGRGTYKPASAALPGEITWLNQPAFDQRTPLSFSSIDAQPVFIELDVTWLIEAWASGFPNHGLMLRPLGRPDASSPEAMFGFYAREHAEIEKRPKLILAREGGDAVDPVTTSVQPSSNTQKATDIPPSITPGQAAVEVIADFEHGSLKGWEKTGTAFDHQPTYGDNSTARHRGQRALHQGDYWIGSFEKYQGTASENPGATQGDGPQGTLESYPFRIRSDTLSFLVGGGCDLESVRVELLVNGNVVLQTTGRCAESMHREYWDVSAWHGQEARIRLIDASSGAWGHINFDDLRLESR